MSTEDPRDESPAEVVETTALLHEHALEIRRAGDHNVIRILSPDGRPGVSITLTAQGITLDVSGGDLTLKTTGALAIDADTVSLHGRNGVAIESGGDAAIRAAGDIQSEGRSQEIKARLGSVSVKANDDVKLNGERIKLNA